MNKIVLCYSLSGHSEKLAKEFAEKSGGTYIEVKTVKKIGKVASFLIGCPKAILGKPIAVLPLSLPDYGEADVFAPIWAGSFAPPMLAALQQLNQKTNVHLYLVSGSGTSNQEKNTKRIEALGLKVVGYEDIKG